MLIQTNSKNKVEENRRKAGVACVKALEAAGKKLNAYLAACNDCADGSGSRGADDGRILLIRNIVEYERYLSSLYC